MWGEQYCIYVIKNTINNRVYVGRSSQPETRWKAHIAKLRRGCHPVEDLQFDFDQFGEDVFDFKIIEIVDPKNSYKTYKEYKWMQKLRSTDRATGYNYNDMRAIHHIEQMEVNQ